MSCWLKQTGARREDECGVLAGATKPDVPFTPLDCLHRDRSGDEYLRGLGTEEWNQSWEIVQAKAGQALLARRLALADLRPPAEIAAHLRTDVMSIAGSNLAGRKTLATAIKATGRPESLIPCSRPWRHDDGEAPAESARTVARVAMHASSRMRERPRKPAYFRQPSGIRPFRTEYADNSRLTNSGGVAVKSLNSM